MKWEEFLKLFDEFITSYAVRSTCSRSACAMCSIPAPHAESVLLVPL